MGAFLVLGFVASMLLAGRWRATAIGQPRPGSGSHLLSGPLVRWRSTYSATVLTKHLMPSGPKGQRRSVDHTGNAVKVMRIAAAKQQKTSWTTAKTWSARYGTMAPRQHL